jgi:hypothetical protein
MFLFLLAWYSIRSEASPQRDNQSSQSEGAQSHAVAVRVDQGPKMDGTLDDPLWQLAKPITDFRQREPQEGEPATGNRAAQRRLKLF